jgi:hypothetical protein
MIEKVSRLWRASLLLALVGVAVSLSPRSATAHNIPVQVNVQTFIHPEGNVLRMLVRVPLGSMRDIQFPVRGPGFINISEAQPYLRDAALLWIGDYVQLYENDQLLRNQRLVAARISLPSDRSFASYEEALDHTLNAPPLPDETEVIWQQAMIDVLFEYPITSAESRFSIHSQLAHLGLTTNTVLRFDLPGSDERLYQFTGDPGVIQLDPRWYQAAFRFVEMGFLHILDGIDHLLFLLCLVAPFRRVMPVITLVTAFTVAHSITLAASALGYAPIGLWFPPLIEVLIALSIVYMALENIVGANLHRRWLVAFGFGLVHGFGFSFALRQALQFAGAHLVTSLFSFNLGVELGQIGVLLVTVPALGWLFRHVVEERMGVIIVSVLVGHTAWHWMADRWGALRQFAFQLPPLDVVFLLSAIRWTMAILVLIGLAWILRGVFGKLEDLAGERVRSRVTPEA